MALSIINRRIKTFLHEKFEGKINLSDVERDDTHIFETRAQAAYAIMMFTDIDEDQAAQAVTDGYHDCGIDAVYIDNLQQCLYIVQSKWQNDTNGSISKSEMQDFVQATKRVLELDLNGVNEKLASKIPDIDKAISAIGFQIHLIFVHTGKGKHNDFVFEPMYKLLSRVNEDVGDAEKILTYHEIGNKELYDSMSQSQNGANIDIDDVVLQNWGRIDNPYKAYYGIINASTIAEWYKLYGNRLFAKNIRYYKGNTDVNNGIKKTLLNDPEKFFYFNNGIKLLCNKVTKKAINSPNNDLGTFYLSGVSLVNGAQTTGSIGQIYEDNRDAVAKAYVLIEIIDLNEAPKETADQITRLSNTQNRIENKDFAALDPEQDRIRKDLIFSHYQYLYKSGDSLTDQSSQITFDETVIALACYTDISYAALAKRNVGALTDDISKAPYKRLFNSSTNSFIIINSVLLDRIVEKILTEERKKSSGKQKLVCIHGNRFIEYCCLQRYKIEISDFDQEVVVNNSMEQEIAQTIVELITAITSIINQLYSDSYPANIFKNQSKCQEIYNQLIQI
ncbi:MAG: AIPR family protein [Bilifractor sp.]|jgi:hypothetical protein